MYAWTCVVERKEKKEKERWQNNTNKSSTARVCDYFLTLESDHRAFLDEFCNNLGNNRNNNSNTRGLLLVEEITMG
jgi:hypothetical protein